MINEEENMELKEVLKIAFGNLDDKFDKVYQQINDLKVEITQQIDDFKDEVNQRLEYQEKWLNRIESNMVQKNSFNALLTILEQKEVISEYDSAHILHPTTI